MQHRLICKCQQEAKPWSGIFLLAFIFLTVPKTVGRSGVFPLLH